MKVNETIKAQIEQIRLGGKVNMLDANGVQKIAHDENLHELVIFIEDNRKHYAEYILTGVCEID